MQFAGYKKGATGIVWEAAATTGAGAHAPEQGEVPNLVSQRPEQVVTQIAQKFLAIRGRENTSYSQPWVNMGQESAENLAVFLSYNGDFITARQILDRQLHYEGRNRLQEASCGQPSPRILDLGTAGCSFASCPGTCDIPWSSITGVAATDSRRDSVAHGTSQDHILDESYVLLNNDTLHEHTTTLHCRGLNRDGRSDASGFSGDERLAGA